MAVAVAWWWCSVVCLAAASHLIYNNPNTLIGTTTAFYNINININIYSISIVAFPPTHTHYPLMSFFFRKSIGSALFFASGYTASHSLGLSSTDAQFQPRSLSEQKQDILATIHLSSDYARCLADSNFSGGSLSASTPATYRKNHVAQGLLYGKDLFEIDPIIFTNEKQGELVAFYHIGKNLTDANGNLHHGILGLLLDEGLCFCGFPQLPSKRGVTGRLDLDFVNKVSPGETLVLKAKVTLAKGRKVVIDGEVLTLAGAASGTTATTATTSTAAANGLVLAKGHCVLVEPKWFKYFNWIDLFKTN